MANLTTATIRNLNRWGLDPSGFSDSASADDAVRKKMVEARDARTASGSTVTGAFSQEDEQRVGGGVAATPAPAPAPAPTPAVTTTTETAAPVVTPTAAAPAAAAPASPPTLDDFPEFRAVFNKTENDEGYQAKFDFNSDKIIDFTDFLAFVDQGGQPLQDAATAGQDQEADLMARFPEFKATFNKKAGEAGFEAKFDINSDKIIDFTDLLAFAGGERKQEETGSLSKTAISDDEFLANFNSGDPTQTARLREIAIARGIGTHREIHGGKFGVADLLRILQGETGAGDTGAGDTGSGDTGSGDTGSGDTGSGDTGSGDTGSGDTGSGDTGSGDTGSGDTGSGDTGSGDTGTGDTGTGGTGEAGTSAVDDVLSAFRNDLLSNVGENPTQKDVRDVLGAERNPLEKTALDLAGGLGFDVEKQITDSDQELDDLFEKSKEEAARIFAIGSGGLQTGAAQRGFEHLDRDLNIAKAQARQKIRAQGGAEERANIETISGLLTAREQKDVTDATLAMQQQASDRGFQLDEARITGVLNKVGPASFAAFNETFNAKEGDPNYNSDHDYNADGVVDFEDFLEYDAAASNHQVTTLAGRTLQADLANQQFQQTIARSGLTGTFEGQQIVAEKQRLWGNRTTETQMFGGPPPVTFTQDELTGAVGSKRGDVNYRADMDTDNDGVINDTDVQAIGARTEDLGDGVMMYTPPGRQTLAARELGLDERKFVEASTQFNTSTSVRRSEFMQTMSGYNFATNEDGSLSLDADGNPTQMRVQTGTDAFGDPVYGPATTLDRDKFTAGKDQFDRELAQSFEQFTQTLGFKEKELAEMVRTGNFNALLSGLKLLFNVGGGAAASTVASAVTGGGAAAGGGGGTASAAGAGKITLPGLIAHAALPAALFTAELGVVHFLNKLFGSATQTSTAVASTILDPSTTDPAVLEEIYTALEEDSDIFGIGRPVTRAEVENGEVGIPDSLLRDIVGSNAPEGVSFEDAIGNSTRLELGSGTQVGFTQQVNADGTIGVGAPEGTALDELKQINGLQAHQVGMKPEVFTNIVAPIIGDDPALAREFNSDPNKFLEARGYALVSGAVTKTG